MRGKKVDTEFLSNFIIDCVQQNISSPKEISQCAQDKIYEIDKKIKEVESLKIIRSKLLDVLSTFDKPNLSSKIEDIKILSFYDIKNHNIGKIICDLFKTTNTVKISNIKNDKYSLLDINFTIKQLIEHKIIYKLQEYILKGDKYYEYMTFILQEK